MADKKLFLQLPDPINKGNEEGLLGLAFHPKYKDNKQFFVYYSANDKREPMFGRFPRFRATSSDPRLPTRQVKSASGCPPKTRSKTTMEARSHSVRTDISTSLWETAAPPTIR